MDTLSRAALRDAVIGGVCHLLSLPVRLHLRRRNGRLSRVVIVKPGSLGDVLMATAAVRALRRSLPHAHLAFAVGAWSLPMVAGNPHLDAIVNLGAVGSRGYG